MGIFAPKEINFVKREGWGRGKGVHTNVEHGADSKEVHF